MYYRHKEMLKMTVPRQFIQLHCHLEADINNSTSESRVSYLKEKGKGVYFHHTNIPEPTDFGLGVRADLHFGPLSPYDTHASLEIDGYWQSSTSIINIREKRRMRSHMTGGTVRSGGKTAAQISV
jgi:hypothetical protein